MGISRRLRKQQIRARMVEKTDVMSAPVGLAVARSFGDPVQDGSGLRPLGLTRTT
jgi:hypothetical protein